VCAREKAREDGENWMTVKTRWAAGSAFAKKK
jgi:hypothetical protein